MASYENWQPPRAEGDEGDKGAPQGETDPSEDRMNISFEKDSAEDEIISGDEMSITKESKAAERAELALPTGKEGPAETAPEPSPVKEPPIIGSSGRPLAPEGAIPPRLDEIPPTRETEIPPRLGTINENIPPPPFLRQLQKVILYTPGANAWNISKITSAGSKTASWEKSENAREESPVQ